MNIFGVGPAEAIVILVVALIFVGPERLPRLAADIARTIREIRKYTGSLAAEFNDVIKDFENDTAGERSQWKEIGEGLTGATRSVTDAIRDARTEAAAPLPPSAAATAVEAPTPTAPPENGSPLAEGATENWVTIAEPADAGTPVFTTHENGHAPAPAPSVEDVR